VIQVLVVAGQATLETIQTTAVTDREGETTVDFTATTTALLTTHPSVTSNEMSKKRKIYENTEHIPLIVCSRGKDNIDPTIHTSP
jgi:hypothetical protein